jgi:hypothetical protein
VRDDAWDGGATQRVGLPDRDGKGKPLLDGGGLQRRTETAPGRDVGIEVSEIGRRRHES